MEREEWRRDWFPSQERKHQKSPTKIKKAKVDGFFSNAYSVEKKQSPLTSSPYN